MIKDSDLSWMKPGAATDAAQTQSSSDEDEMRAARNAIGEVDKNMLRKSSLAGKEDSFQGVVEMLSARGKQQQAKAVDWAELKTNSSSWAPPSVSERNGHPAHSLEAFEAIYELRAELGNGGFAQVFVASRRKPVLGLGAQQVAVKIIKTGKGCTEKDLEEEADLARKLDHPNIISAIDAYWTTNPRDELRLVEEYAAGGELFKWCRARGQETVEGEQRRLATELLRGLSYLHAHGLIHRDIKPKNLLMANTDIKSPLRIADFGLCKRLRKGNTTSKEASSAPKVVKRRPRTNTRGFVGTANWMAPEVLVCACDTSQGYSFPADVWSAGCVMFGLLSNRFDDNGPFSEGDDDEALEAIYQSIFEKKLPLDHISSSDAQDLLRKMLALVPGDRISAAKALEHPWLDLPRVSLPSIISRRAAETKATGSGPCTSARRSPSFVRLPTDISDSRQSPRGNRQETLKPIPATSIPATLPDETSPFTPRVPSESRLGRSPRGGRRIIGTISSDGDRDEAPPMSRPSQPTKWKNPLKG